jgi:hypothetical protein
MDTKRFDSLTRRLAAGAGSRRRLLALGAGLGLLGFSQRPDSAAAACRKNGRECGRGGDRSCCSGTCKRGKCRPTPGAKGCTVRHDTCEGTIVECPNKPGGFCIKLDNGKPQCMVAGNCKLCSSNSDCTDLPDGKCVKTCDRCTETNRQGCYYPRPLN